MTPKTARHFGGWNAADVSEALVLTLVAGFVDAVGFLRLGGIYIANMSGNSVAIGIYSASHAWAAAGERSLPVVFYLAGLIISRAMIYAERDRRLGPVGLSPILLEISLLFLFARSANLHAAIALGALAMGVQAAAITRFNRMTVYTGFVTGSLIKLADHLVAWLRGKKPFERRLAREQTIWFLGIWLAYVAGAVGGAIAFPGRGAPVVYWTFPVLGTVAAFLAFRGNERPCSESGQSPEDCSPREDR